MKLNGTIESLPAFVTLLVTLFVGGNWIEARRNPRPPLSRYHKDGGTPWVAFWNVFDESKFTPEAIEYHRRRLRSIPAFLLIFALGWLILDLIW